MDFKLTSLDTLKQKKKMRIHVKNKFVLVAYTEDGIFAINDKCPHMGASLYPGKLEGKVIRCKDHGLPVSLETGLVTDEAKAKFLNLEEWDMSVKQYEPFVKDGYVYINIK